MARRASSEEQKIITILNRLPLADEDKNAWIETMNDSGLNEEMAKDIMQKVSELPRPEEDDLAMRRARDSVEVNNLIRRWRLNENLRSTRKR